MNQSLKEFMKSINTNNKSTTDTNLDITNLDEDESIKPAGRYSNDDLNENTLNSNSTTAEFRKYLEKAGVIDQLTRVLVGLYEEPDKPNNAIEY